MSSTCAQLLHPPGVRNAHVHVRATGGTGDGGVAAGIDDGLTRIEAVAVGGGGSWSCVGDAVRQS